MVYNKMGTRAVTLTVLILPTEMNDTNKRSRTRKFRQQGKFTNQVRITGPAALVTHHHAP